MATMMEELRQSKPPQPVVWAVIATAINAIGGVIFAVAWPDLDERGTIIGVSAVLGVLMLAAAAWLWTGARWGAIATIALNAFNILLGIPAFFQDDASVIVGLVVSTALSVIAIAVLFMREAKQFWNGVRV